MNWTLLSDLEQELNHGMDLIDFMIQIADHVFDGISDPCMSEWMVDEGYFSNRAEMMEFYDNN